MSIVQEYIALAVLALVYALIIGRTRFGVPIWASMLIGAALMVAAQIIPPQKALYSINLDVIGFLFGMFTIVTSLDRAGVLRRIAVKIVSSANSPPRLLLAFVVGMGSLAAFLVNDTIALLAIPLVIYVAKKSLIRPTILFLGLAYGITVGSVMTPIGNPQNLIVAIQSGIAAPFLTFLIHLAVPTVISLFVTYAILRLVFRHELSPNNQLTLQTELKRNVVGRAANVLGEGKPGIYQRSISSVSSVAEHEPLDLAYDKGLARISIVVLLVTISGFIISEVLSFLHIVQFGLSAVAMMGAVSIYAISKKRVEIIRNIDYSVLIFFAAMFVVTAALWQSGAVSNLLLGPIPTPDPNNLIQSTAAISLASISASQFLSNVPFVALYDPVLLSAGFGGSHVVQWMMLAAASTIAGNLTILGAASNIIIIEAAESRGVCAFRYIEFLKIGILVTAANLGIFYFFLVFI